MIISRDHILQLSLENPDLVQEQISMLENFADISYALEIIGSVREPWVVDFIKPYLYHTHPMVREGAIYGMAERFRSGSLNAGALLLEVLKSPPLSGTSEKTNQFLKDLISDVFNI